MGPSERLWRAWMVKRVANGVLLGITVAVGALLIGYTIPRLGTARGMWVRYYVQTPLALAIVPTGAVLILARDAIKRRSRQASSQTCPTCGYSMVGTDDEKACPECGKVSSAESRVEEWQRRGKT